MLSKFKITAVALAVLLATATFTASTEQAQAAKLSTGARVVIGVGAALLAGAVLATRPHGENKVFYGGRHHGHRWNASDDGDFGGDGDGPRFGHHRKHKFDRFDD